MNQPQVDDAALNELKEMLEDDFSELISTYVSDTQAKLTAIESALQLQSAEDVRKYAHSVKGASINIGITLLSSICSDIERAAVEGDLERCRGLYADAQAEAALVITFLSEEFL